MTLRQLPAPSIPVIDIAGFYGGSPETKREIAIEIDRACRESGFLIVAGHRVAPEISERLWDTTRRFFDLPEGIKNQSVSPSPDIYRGYRAVATSALARSLGDQGSAPDYREGFSINRPRIDETDPYYTSLEGQSYFHENIYPAAPPELKRSLIAYYDAMEDLAGTLMQLFAIALALEEHWFEDKIDKHITGLLLSNYPAQIAAPAQNQVRAGAHTDYGSLTILLAEDKPGGLEVQGSDGVWRAVSVIPGTFIVNIGDLMAQWTNDRWVSTMHRVVNPPAGTAQETRRQSIAFFHQPNYDARVECIPSCVGEGVRYPPVTSGDHLMAKIASTVEIGGNSFFLQTVLSDQRGSD